MSIRVLAFTLSLLFLASHFTACGGGGGGGASSSQPQQSLQSAAGIWNGQLTIGSTVNDLSCLITKTGESTCVLYERGTDTIIGSMTAQVSVSNGNQLSGSGTAYALPGYVLVDGVSTVASVTVTGGTVSSRSTIELAFSVLGGTGELTATFDTLYDQDSSLDVVAGSYSTFNIGQDTASFFVNSGGALSGRTSRGCTLVGQVAVIDPAVNGYSVDLAVSNCPELNGSYAGLAVVTDSAVDDQGLLFGVFSDTTAILGAPIRTEVVVTSGLKLVANDGSALDNFGVSVATDGIAIAIGANSQDDFAVDSGAVYIFSSPDQINWAMEAKIKANDAAAGDLFGAYVDIDADVVFASAFFDDDNGSNAGAAYIFEKDPSGTWMQQDKLTANDGSTEDRFGQATVISEQTAVCGAGWDDINGSRSGSAYVFSRDSGGNWVQTTKLIPTDAEPNAWFGHDAAIQTDTILVGARRDGGDGSVYVFERDIGDGWTQTSKLRANDLSFDARFGTGLAIDGDTVVVGAFADDVNGADSGSAYVFVKDGTGVWNLQAKLMPADGSGGDWFGYWLDVEGDAAIIGAEYADGLVPGSGAAYLFTRDSAGNWSQTSKITAGDGANGDRFGRSISMKNNVVVISAPDDDDNGEDSGSVYVLRLDELM